MSPRSSAVFSSKSISKAMSSPSTGTSAAETDKDRLSASSSSLPSMKDRRAYEHDRQRVKKAAGLVKAKARKEQGWPRTLSFHDSYKRGQGVVVPLEKDTPTRDEEVGSLDRLGLAEALCDNEAVTSKQRSEVTLVELITYRKPRKVKEGDFEVIPPVRSVIVLDDSITQDLVIDEPWEHIFGENEEQASVINAPSYASILSLTK